MFRPSEYYWKYQLTKGNVYAVLGLISGMLIVFGPWVISAYLVFGEGKILAGILLPFVFAFAVGASIYILPIIWIAGGFFYSFWFSTIWCALVTTMVLLPDIFFNLANKKYRKSLKIE